ncbi:MAG: hypothetical protein IH624_00380 [Phycisphaerae bacterium]|nr:hypothetical protein [Phycisphaerae bacterium]
MVEALQVSLTIPIHSVGLLDDSEDGAAARAAAKQLQAELERQRQKTNRLCAALETACRRMENFYDESICSQAECVARLSVRIAEKILRREIASGNYDIGQIVAEALEAAPTQQNVLIRMHPEDLAHYTQMVESQKIQGLSSVALEADPAVGRAECVVATDQGTIENFIDEHLRQIGEALEGLE